MNRPHSVVDKLIAPLGKCLTPEVAQRIASLRAHAVVQDRVEYLADRANKGALSNDERDEYQQYVSFSQFVTLLQIEARNLIDAKSETQ